MNKAKIVVVLSSIIILALLIKVIANVSHYQQNHKYKNEPAMGVIAFVKSMDLKGDFAQQIYLINEDGSNVRNISNNADHMDEDPAWSPDGKKIAFDCKIYYLRGDVTKWDIYVMNADGSDIIKLTDSKDDYDYNAAPAWSPDGKKIAFVHTAKIWVMDSDGSNKKCLIKDDDDATIGSIPRIKTAADVIGYLDPAWSPDGKKIAFQSESLDEDICVIDADGSNFKRLTNNKAGNRHRHPTWSPDGKQIAFESTRNKRRDIYIMDADGSNERKLTNNDNISKAGIEYPAWSPAKGNKKGDITPPPK